MGIKKIVLLVLVAALAIAAAESATAHSYYYPQSSMMQAMQNPYGYSPGAYYQNTPSYHALPFFSMGFYNNSAASRGYMMQKQYPQRTYYPSPRAYNYGTSSSSNPQTLNVSISNFSFSPQTLTVHVGEIMTMPCIQLPLIPDASFLPAICIPALRTRMSSCKQEPIITTAAFIQKCARK